MKIVATNPNAGRDYEIIETWEAGISLKGSEIKSIRSGQVNIRDSFSRIDDKGEVYLYNAHISPYLQASYLNVDPKRPRKLLLHKKEITKIFGKIAQRGLALVPTKLYFKNGMIKVELALGKGKRQYDKRQAIRKRETDLEIRRAMRLKRKYQ